VKNRLSDQHVSSIFLSLSVLAFVTGQCAYWSRSGGPFSSDAEQVVRPDFAVQEVRAEPVPESKHAQQIVRILPNNRLDQSVVILGGISSCRPWGCYEPIDLPLEIGPREEQWLKIKASWSTDPARPLPICVFTNLSVTEFVNLDLLPNSATIREPDKVTTGANAPTFDSHETSSGSGVSSHEGKAALER